MRSFEAHRPHSRGSTKGVDATRLLWHEGRALTEEQRVVRGDEGVEGAGQCGRECDCVGGAGRAEHTSDPPPLFVYCPVSFAFGEKAARRARAGQPPPPPARSARPLRGCVGALIRSCSGTPLCSFPFQCQTCEGKDKEGKGQITYAMVRRSLLRRRVFMRHTAYQRA